MGTVTVRCRTCAHRFAARGSLGTALLEVTRDRKGVRVVALDRMSSKAHPDIGDGCTSLIADGPQDRHRVIRRNVDLNRPLSHAIKPCRGCGTRPDINGAELLVWHAAAVAAGRAWVLT